MDQEPHVAGHQMKGEDEHHHEKTTVMQKVKAKARKIKDTVTKHGHGHNHDHDHDHDLDEEDDDNEDDTSECPEIHGAPIYDSVDKKNVGVTNAGRSTAMDVDPLPPAPAPALGNVKPYAGGHYHEEEGSKSHPGATLVFGEAPKAPQNTPVSHSTTDSDPDHTRDQDPARTFVPGRETHSGQPQVNLQRPKGGLLEDPAALTTPGADRSSNYQTKVADPSGISGGEAEVGSVISSFNKMGMDESKPKSTGQEQNWPTGTENFHTSLPTGSHDQFSPEVTPPKPVTRTEDHPRCDIGGDIGSTEESFGSPEDNVADRQSNQSSYTGKISSATSAIANTAISAKNVVASKLGYGQQGERGGHKTATEKTATTTSTGSEKDHGVGGKESNQSQSTYAGKISSAAISAKNVVASKLGYGGEQGEAGGHDTTTVTEKTGTAGTGIEKEHGDDGQDKGVSVKDYLAEKLRPGEEDKALSELISETLHKEDKPLSPRPVTEAINDAFYNRHEEPQEEARRPMGKVTESKEVARRLGTTEVDPSKGGSDSSFVDNSGTSASTGMVGKIKGAVGSWFGGKGEESQIPQQQPHSAPTDSAFDEAGHKN